MGQQCCTYPFFRHLRFTYKTIIPIIIKTSTILVLLGLVTMYLNGEVTLTSNTKKNVKHKGEM